MKRERNEQLQLDNKQIINKMDCSQIELENKFEKVMRLIAQVSFCVPNTDVSGIGPSSVFFKEQDNFFQKFPLSL